MNIMWSETDLEDLYYTPAKVHYQKQVHWVCLNWYKVKTTKTNSGTINRALSSISANGQ